MYQTSAGRAATQNEKTAPIELLVRPRGKPLLNMPLKTYALPSDTTDQLYLRIAAKARCTINHIRLTKSSDGSLIPNSDKVTVDGLGLYEGNTIHVKDLGPQVAWKTVFIIEYLGPLLIHPLLFLLRPYIYSNPRPASTAQYLSFMMLMVHFLKRELETLYVHRFSNATMPIFNIFKNSAHYWILAGFGIAVFTYSPSPSCPTANPSPFPGWNVIAVLMFLVGELGNAATHLQLRDLRSQGGKERGIPSGGVFSIVNVTCPNYFFETMAWLGIWMTNRSLSTAVFLAVSGYTMVVWAQKKERRYRSEFGDEYRKKRYAMLPGII